MCEYVLDCEVHAYFILSSRPAIFISLNLKFYRTNITAFLEALKLHLYYNSPQSTLLTPVFSHHNLSVLNLIFIFPCIMTQYTKMTNKMQLCRIIYYSLAALHVSSNIFVHHRQEHLNCIAASGIIHVCRCRLVSWESHGTPIIPAGSDIRV